MSYVVECGGWACGGGTCDKGAAGLPGVWGAGKILSPNRRLAEFPFSGGCGVGPALAGG